MSELLGGLPERLGFEVVAATPELVHVPLVPQPDLHHRFGALHGGVLFSLADSATAGTRPPGRRVPGRDA